MCSRPHLASCLARPTLQHGGGGQVHELHDRERAKQRGGHDRVVIDGHSDDGKAGAQNHQVDGGHVDGVGESLIQSVLVLGERVQHIANGRAQEEQDGRLRAQGMNRLIAADNFWERRGFLN
jgi:hypothetical protein